MLPRRFILTPDKTWAKISRFSIVCLFIYFADSLLAFFVPGLIQEYMGSALLMGMIISSSSVVGLITDFIFPQIIKGISVYRILFFTISFGALFAVLVSQARGPIFIVTILLAMAVWGVYYELLSFAKQQFVSSVPKVLHSGASAMLFAFRCLAYTISPILATLLIARGQSAVATVALLFSAVALLLHFIIKNHTRVTASFDLKEINIASEIKHWWVLLKHVWPVVLLGLMIWTIDATFWTTGTVLSARLAKDSFWGALILPAYMLPSVISSFLVLEWRISVGKKRKATLFFIVSSLVLFAVGFVTKTPFLVFMVLISSLLSAVCYPLIDATYSDIVARMGKQKLHLIGLTNSATSLAYIIGPTLAGATASILGEQKTLAVMGLLGITVGYVILVLTPKKLKLPQKEMGKWSE